MFTNDENNFTINQSVSRKIQIYIVSVPAYLISVCMVLDIHMHQRYTEAGADHKEVQERGMGHANIKTTMDTYTHITNSKKKETTQKLTNYIKF